MKEQWRGYIVGALSLIVVMISFMGVLSFFDNMIYPIVKYILVGIFSYSVPFLGLVNRKNINKIAFGWSSFIGLISMFLSILIFLYFPDHILLVVWLIGVHLVGSKYEDNINEKSL